MGGKASLGWPYPHKVARLQVSTFFVSVTNKTTIWRVENKKILNNIREFTNRRVVGKRNLRGSRDFTDFHIISGSWQAVLNLRMFRGFLFLFLFSGRKTDSLASSCCFRSHLKCCFIRCGLIYPWDEARSQKYCHPGHICLFLMVPITNVIINNYMINVFSPTRQRMKRVTAFCSHICYISTHGIF